MHPKAGVKHLCPTRSDHNPILLDTHLEEAKLNRPFGFEAMWTRDETSREVVHNAWQTEVEGSHSYRLVRKQDVIKAELKKWNKTSFGYANERINELEAKLAEIQKAELSKKNLEKEAALSMELDEWQARNETKWNQKSWELWIKEGDKNTRFFHLSTLKRMRRNVISEIKLDDGSWAEIWRSYNNISKRNSALYIKLPTQTSQLP